MDISFTACLLVCTVTDLSREDKASGVKFCKVVHGRPGQAISHFGNCSPRSQKSDESAFHQEVIFSVVMATVIASACNAYDRHVWIASVAEDRRKLTCHFNLLFDASRLCFYTVYATC